MEYQIERSEAIYNNIIFGKVIRSTRIKMLKPINFSGNTITLIVNGDNAKKLVMINRNDGELIENVIEKCQHESNM